MSNKDIDEILRLQREEQEAAKQKEIEIDHFLERIVKEESQPLSEQEAINESKSLAYWKGALLDARRAAKQNPIPVFRGVVAFANRKVRELESMRFNSEV